MAHQVLCIESSRREDGIHVTKGEIYNSINQHPLGIKYRNIDLWHILAEIPLDISSHVSLFIDLPTLEGQSFSKKVDEPVKIKKEELVEQD